MDIEKYKKELETAIYEGADEKLYIGGKVVEKVLNEAVNEALRIHAVSTSFCVRRRNNNLIKNKMGYIYKKATYDPNWIDVKQQLPKEGEKVIFYSTRYDMQATAEFRTGVFIFGGARYRLDEVSHWQSLLLPPESVAEQNEC